MSPQPEGAYHFRFGICTDIQHADISDGCSFAGIPRFYRAALECTSRAVAGWKSSGVQFGMHLGDIVDGYAKENASSALDAVLGEFSQLGQRTFHLVGNHCLYNLPRSHLNQQLGIDGPPCGGSYYSFCPHPLWRIVMLDSYDISSLGWDRCHPKAKMANTLLERLNPNKEKNSPEGLVGTDRRFVQFNGGIGPDQLAWMEGQFKASADYGQRVIVGSHIPIHPESADTITLVWNYEEVLGIIHRYPNVVLTLAGHTHRDNYHQDTAGVHHRVIKGIIETSPGHDCYGIVDVYNDAVIVTGAGIESAVMKVRSFSDLMGPQSPPERASSGRPTFGQAARDVMEMLPSVRISE